jgi:hypothetical protein
MKDAFPGEDWNLADERGQIGTWERVGIAVLMDIRRELVRLNALLACSNFTGIPRTLRAIAKNTSRKRRKP